MRIMRFSLELAEASGRRERFSRQVADVVTKRSGTNESRWFYNRKAPENKSESSRVVAELTRFTVLGAPAAKGTEQAQGSRLRKKSQSDYIVAEMRTGAAGFCNLPSSIAEPFNCSYL